MDRSSFTFEAMIRDYHVYKDVWNSTLDEELPCQKETGNISDPFARWRMANRSRRESRGQRSMRTRNLGNLFLKVTMERHLSCAPASHLLNLVFETSTCACRINFRKFLFSHMWRAFELCENLHLPKISRYTRYYTYAIFDKSKEPRCEHVGVVTSDHATSRVRVRALSPAIYARSRSTVSCRWPEHAHARTLLRFMLEDQYLLYSLVPRPLFTYAEGKGVWQHRGIQ